MARVAGVPTHPISCAGAREARVRRPAGTTASPSLSDPSDPIFPGVNGSTPPRPAASLLLPLPGFRPRMVLSVLPAFGQHSWQICTPSRPPGTPTGGISVPPQPRLHRW